METISFIGGDDRNFFLSKMFDEDSQVYLYGLKEDNIDLNNCLSNSKYIVTSVPFSVDDEHIYAPLSNKSISIKELTDNAFNKTIICGNIKKQFKDALEGKNNTVVDIMKNEELSIKNSVPTAEGIVKIIIENTDITIDNSNIAILGFGRVGKKTAELLKSLKANIFCFDIKEEEVANIHLCGYNVLNDICESLKKMDVIINTVPELIIDKEHLNYINKDSLILDVASKPGGVDFNYATENNYKVIHALGLPGKIAPRTSAKYIKEMLENIVR